MTSNGSRARLPNRFLAVGHPIALVPGVGQSTLDGFSEQRVIFDQQKIHRRASGKKQFHGLANKSSSTMLTGLSNPSHPTARRISLTANPDRSALLCPKVRSISRPVVTFLTDL